MKSIWRGLKALLLVALGAGLAVGLGQCGATTFPSHWFVFHADTKQGVMPNILSEQTMKKFEGGCDLPDISTLSGKAKFVPRGDYQAPLGYEVVLALQSKEEMQREAQERGVKLGANSRLVFPNWVSVKLRFTLRDKDGFEIARLKSGDNGQDWPFHVYTGRPKTIKGLTLDKVSIAQARETKSVECEVQYYDMGEDGQQ